MRVLSFVCRREQLTGLLQPQTIELLMEDGSYPLTEDDTYTLDGDDFPGYRFILRAPRRGTTYVSRRDQLAMYNTGVGFGLLTEASEYLCQEDSYRLATQDQEAWQLRMTAR